MENKNDKKTVINIQSLIKRLVIMHTGEDTEGLNKKITWAVNSTLDKCVKTAATYSEGKETREILALRDKHGRVLKNDDVVRGVLPGLTESYNWRVYYNKKHKKFEMICCEYGYVEPLQNFHLQSMEWIGEFKELKHLFKCD